MKDFYSINKRQYNIDFLRGMAFIFVMLGHAISLMTVKNVINRNIGYLIYNIIYSFHMPLYFAISGYVCFFTNFKNKKIHSLLLKEIVSLYIPYLFFNYVYWFERIIASKIGVELDNDIRVSLKSIVELLYIGDGMTWFLLSLLLVKLICDILLKYLPDYIALIFFSFIFWLSYCGYGSTFTYYLSWGLFYIIGYLINKYAIDKVELQQKVILIIILLSIIGSGISMFVNYGLDQCVKLLIGISLFIILASITGKMNKRVFILNFLGEQSIVAYIIHGLSQFFTYFIASKFITQPVILIICILFLQIIIIWVIYQIITKIKFLKWCQFFFYPAKFLKL